MLSETFVQETHLIYRVVNGETLLVNAVSNKWYRLNEIATLIFACLKSPATIEGVEDRLFPEFAPGEVSHEQLLTDIVDFVRYMVEERLILPASRQPQP